MKLATNKQIIVFNLFVATALGLFVYFVPRLLANEGVQPAEYGLLRFIITFFLIGIALDFSRSRRRRKQR